MTNTGWKAFEGKTIPTLSGEKQRRAPLKFTPSSRQRIGRTSYLQMSVLSIYFITRIHKTTSYGTLRSAKFPGIPGLSDETKCKSDGVGRYDEL